MKSKEALLKLCFKYLPTIDEMHLNPDEEDEKLLNIIQKDLEVLECFKKYFHFELAFEKNQTFLIFKSKERYLPADGKISVPNKYYEPLKEWLNDK